MVGFYRSAQPSELNFSFLEKMNLKSVIWAGAEQPSEILSVLHIYVLVSGLMVAPLSSILKG